MTIIVLFIAIILVLYSLIVRCVVMHPFNTLYYAVRDSSEYFKHKRWNECPYGQIISLCGLFGRGKTLSLVKYATRIYLRYNGKQVYCTRRKKWVTQVIKIYSNVDIAIPHETFSEMKQIVNVSKMQTKIDDEDDILTVSLFLGDEFSVQMNSRSFKTNISPTLLNTILTCRHHRITLAVSSQRFAHMDALLRQVTSYVVENKKIWRFQCQYYYDAWDLENASNVNLIKPIKRTVWFVKDKDYNAYDTFACVENLEKKCEDGDFISDNEILAMRASNGDIENVINLNRKWKKLHRK